MKYIVRVLLLLCLLSGTVWAQQPAMQFFRPYDKTGLNTFEGNKTDTTPYTGLHVRIGGAFAQDYQALSDENYVALSGKLPKVDSANILDPLTSGFNLAMANMYIDAQLEDGVRANVTVYLSAKHHNESWVKNGYLQIDKLDFLHVNALNDIMKALTIKVGDLEVDYGDQHFRRVDGGNEMYNPFVENYIMDEFATEIGGEIYYHPLSNHIIAMVGVTDGMLNPTVVAANAIDSVTKSPNSYQPAFHFKLGYDNQINSDLRLRLTASMYQESSTSSSTLFGGDRTGSHYFLVLEPTTATTTGNAFSGRFNPGFSDQVTTFMINPFVKYAGFEFFGTYESAKGRKINETSQRSATQMAADALYRFGASENFWIGARYNTVKADLYQTPTTNTPVTINRIVGSLGWFITPNVMMKAEYVSQSYNDYPGGTGIAGTSILNGGKFNGAVIEAVLAF
ncbi:MAG: hypothetical protein Q8922_00195 [Bacteroidota bacterium]|nr:hypothetical protein [Bacteroidota bacterium]MDP4232453.1 hypothetical protein [Bacteroidota bacterium]MDP4241589.1 hypothetical protein [Bacteroidota bacterium]MDP4286333.1 hypothetical protein [Bacteroidota bacterium]